MTATATTALVPIQPAFSDAERLALAGFLAGYRGLTREAYALDLRQFTTWCRLRSLSLFAVRRADIEGFARDLEARGRQAEVLVSARGQRSQRGYGSRPKYARELPFCSPVGLLARWAAPRQIGLICAPR
jgi:hypothetical protein